MKKIQFLLLIFILFLTPNVFASDYKLNSHISATSGGTKNRYGGLENYNYGSYGTYTFGTRYQGRLGNIETYIDYPFEANTTYTLTYNMNTDDFINHFGSSYWWDCSQTMTNSNATVQSVNYISYKKVKFTFTPTANTTCIYVSIRSTNPNSTAITQITNWQLDSIYLYDPDYQGSGGSGGSGGTPTPTPDPNQQIIDNNNQNTSDVIDNNNENTDKIIDNQKELLGNCIKNYMTSSSILSTTNLYTANNSFQQITADTSSTLALVAQGYNNSSYVRILNSTTLRDTGRVKMSFTKQSDFNVLFYKLNGLTQDTGMKIDVSNLRDNTTYYISSDFFNLEQGSIKFRNIMITDINTNEFVPWGEEKCNSKLDSINDSLTDDNVDHGVGSGFFDDFEDEDFGLSSIITIPLNTIQSLTSQSCVALNVPIPFTNSSVSLPCMTQVYQDNIPTIYNLWKIVSFGIIAYFIAIDIFHMVKGFKDPESDKVEVLDL